MLRKRRNFGAKTRQIQYCRIFIVKQKNYKMLQLFSIVQKLHNNTFHLNKNSQHNWRVEIPNVLSANLLKIEITIFLHVRSLFLVLHCTSYERIYPYRDLHSFIDFLKSLEFPLFNYQVIQFFVFSKVCKNGAAWFLQSSLQLNNYNSQFYFYQIFNNISYLLSL